MKDRLAQALPDTGGATWNVSLTGELDLSRRPQLRDVVMAFRRSPAPNARVDLTAVTFMDSTGIGALVSLLKTAASRGGRVCLLGPSDRVARVLQVTGLLPLFEIVDQRDAGT